ncbi:hypothetical protein BVER_03270 [Candidatus Burkholderia verschuerenii]|uniref:Uncharacterized protein n=1 Tax=Candidatus Burkholderia verschuerenii TaxID=242163 RepID=A0A0L0M9T9_9BURK|nr:hypothetical protein [Candidatus Burkholderia verschuerenii]KND59472.1 hypothetical protein BVER_03270 [Candidatus Burkholderia verschuerenii]
MKIAPLAQVTACAAVVGASFVLLPGVCRAQPLESQLDCKSSAHRFIAPLRDDRSIEATPMRVEANSVNAFKPTRGGELTAYGYRVYAVLGYQQGDAIFKQGSGQPINDSAYGVVVMAPSDAVEQRVRESGSSAVVHEVVPMIMTAVFCDGSAMHTASGTLTKEAARSRR